MTISADLQRDSSAPYVDFEAGEYIMPISYLRRLKRRRTLSGCAIVVWGEYI